MLSARTSRITFRLRCSSGSALIELSVIVSVLIAILLGAAEIAMLASDSIEVSDAARAAAVYAAQSSSTAANSTAIRAAAAASASNVSGLVTTPAIFYACSSTPATQNATSPTNCASTDSILTYIQVNTSATVNMPVHFYGSSFTVKGQAIMRVQ